MAASLDICPICNKRVRTDARFLNCSLCSRKVHNNCTALSWHDIDSVSVNLQLWSCQICNSEIFPFNHISETEEFNLALYELRLDKHLNGNPLYREKLFDPFTINDTDNELHCETSTPILPITVTIR